MRSIDSGIYRGAVDGVESGHCLARIAVRDGPGGCRIIDYEAVSTQYGLQHVEHDILDGDSLVVACGELRGVTVFREHGNGEFVADGPRPMKICIEYDGGSLGWSWHWGAGSDDVIERSRAVCRPAPY